MKANSEIEIVMYARIGNPAGLAKADRVEDQIQLEARLMDGNKVRVRRTDAPGKEVSYVFTAKRKTGENAGAGSMEYSSIVDEAFFQAFEQGAMEQKLIKTRYTFKHGGMSLRLGEETTPIQLDEVFYEVDVFKTKGQASDWVKIDVEVDKILEYLQQNHPDLKAVNFTLKPNALPFDPQEMFLSSAMTDEQKALVERLWKEEFAEQVSRPTEEVKTEEEQSDPEASTEQTSEETQDPPPEETPPADTGSEGETEVEDEEQTPPAE